MFTTKPKHWLLIGSKEEKFQLYGILTFSKNLLQALITPSDMGFFVCFLIIFFNPALGYLSFFSIHISFSTFILSNIQPAFSKPSAIILYDF